MDKKTSINNNTGSPDEDNGDLLVRTLLNGIAQYANQKNFAKAERLREELIKASPKAVRAIVKSGEIIEQKKAESMDPRLIKPWADLFNKFNTSEAAAFYYALKTFIAKPNQPVFQQGSCDNRLYFIQTGSLKLKYFDYELKKNVVITTLKKGDVTGIEAFFTFTNHTTNLVAVEESVISYLDKDAYQKILTGHHTIEAKLCAYCDSKKINYFQNAPAPPARRAHERYKANLTGHVQRIDQNGNLLKDISDIRIVDLSSGGLCYIMNHIQIGDAANLHNSKVQITSAYQKYSLSYELKKTGKVVSLKFFPHGECSVHIQFEDLLDESTVMEIAKHTDVTAYLDLLV
ncbi:MAG: cyclic nucleotide-binding domain-containing protein [Desulfobacteraceae bacterium]|nr:cyclic nucleotide-binding domain-containing protein [Desulfobacteraceae bacterium]